MEISLLSSACLPPDVCPDVVRQLRKIKQGLTIEVNMLESAVYIPTSASKL